MNALQVAAEAKREIDGMTDRINDRINNELREVGRKYDMVLAALADHRVQIATDTAIVKTLVEANTVAFPLCRHGSKGTEKT
jgi:hypothetical protein